MAQIQLRPGDDPLRIGIDMHGHALNPASASQAVLNRLADMSSVKATYDTVSRTLLLSFPDDGGGVLQ